MNVDQFLANVQKLAEDNDIKFFLMAEGKFAYRGMVPDIFTDKGLSFDNNDESASGFAEGTHDKGFEYDETFGEFFEMIWRNIPADTGRQYRFNTNLIKGVEFKSIYYVDVAKDRNSVIVYSAPRNAPSERTPLLNVQATPSKNVILTELDIQGDAIVGLEHGGVLDMYECIVGAVGWYTNINKEVASDIEKFMMDMVDVERRRKTS